MSDAEIREVLASVSGRLMDLKMAHDQRRFDDDQTLTLSAMLKSIDTRLARFIADTTP